MTASGQNVNSETSDAGSVTPILPDMQPPESDISDLYPRKFTLFPELPPELRLKIWKHALPNGPYDDGERFLCFNINIVRDDPVKGLDINFSVEYEGKDVMECPPDTPPQETLLESDSKKLDGCIADLKNVTLLSTCVESRGVVLETFKNTLPIGQNGLFRFDNEDLICILNWSSKETRDPIRKARAAKLPVPSFPIRNFSTMPNILGLSMIPGEFNIGNLSILKGLESIQFNGEGLEEHLLPTWAWPSAESQVDAYLQWILENMREQKGIDPDYNIPKLGVSSSKRKNNGHREVKWATLTADTSAFWKARRGVATSVRHGIC
jgi:hypothetical protein